MFRKNFYKTTRFVSTDSSEPHPKFQDVEPISIGEMMRRSILGIPLSVPVAPDDRIPINDSFYCDSMDVLDTAIRHNKKLVESKKDELLKKQEQIRKEQEEFRSWKKQQEQEALKKSLELAQ